MMNNEIADMQRRQIEKLRRAIRATCEVTMEEDERMRKLIIESTETGIYRNLSSIMARMIAVGRDIRDRNRRKFGQVHCPQENITEPWTREEIEAIRDEARAACRKSQHERYAGNSKSVNAEATEAQARRLREKGL